MVAKRMKKGCLEDLWKEENWKELEMRVERGLRERSVRGNMVDGLMKSRGLECWEVLE